MKKTVRNNVGRPFHRRVDIVALLNAAICWSLAPIAIVGWLIAWCARYGLARYIQVDDLATKSFLLGSCAFLILILIKLPKWQVKHLALTRSESFNSENEARKTFAQIVAGIGLVAGLYFTSLQLRETQLAASHNEAITRDGQITDRYIKAVQQLGSTDVQGLPVRIGAVFALERIARESRPDYWPIMELLSAYVRDRSGSPLSPEQLRRLKNFDETMPFAYTTQLGIAPSKNEKSYVILRELNPPGPGYDYVRSWLNEPALEDVQVAMTVIGRRRLEYEDELWRPLNLRFVNLRGLDLRGAHLEGADLEGANLQGTGLTAACLCGANLRDVLMDSTRLNKSDLRRADLTGAVFLNNRDDGADAREAVVQWANAPSHETEESYIGFEHSDTRGMIIGKGIHPLPGSVMAAEEPDISKSTPFPPAKPNSPCLQRSAQIWSSRHASKRKGAKRRRLAVPNPLHCGFIEAMVFSISEPPPFHQCRAEVPLKRVAVTPLGFSLEGFPTCSWQRLKR